MAGAIAFTCALKVQCSKSDMQPTIGGAEQASKARAVLFKSFLLVYGAVKTTINDELLPGKVRNSFFTRSVSWD